MFYILTISGGALTAVCIFGAVTYFKDFKKNSSESILFIFGAIIFLIVFALGWTTPQGQLVWTGLVASGKHGNWLIIDESGGITKRHWILEDGYIESETSSDGWKFTDRYGNICRVSGDSYNMRIEQDLNEFLKTYKEYYNIPEGQKALK
jgi:hypothetical protein